MRASETVPDPITSQPFVDPFHTNPLVCVALLDGAGGSGCGAAAGWLGFYVFGAQFCICATFSFLTVVAHICIYFYFFRNARTRTPQTRAEILLRWAGWPFLLGRGLERKGGLARGRRWKLRAAWLCSKQLQRWRAQVTRAHHGFEMVLVMGYNGFSAVASSSVRSFAIVFSFLERAPRPPARPAHYRQGDEWRVKEERGPFEEATKRFMERILADVLLRVADGGCKGVGGSCGKVVENSGGKGKCRRGKKI